MLGRPKNYRPVTCLPTVYKTITFIIGKRMQNHIDGKNLKPDAQNQRDERPTTNIKRDITGM